MLWAAAAFLLLLLVWGVLVFPGHAGGAARAPFEKRSFAHRGLYSADQSVPENSLSAFDAAVKAGYGVELDVQLTKDEQVVVLHDGCPLRALGVPGAVREYTLAQLKELPLFGTRERIPLFSEALETLGGAAPLIVELKPGGNWRLLCEKTLELLRAYPGAFCVESFHPLIVAWFRRHAPEVLRGQLSEAFVYSRKGLPFLQALVMSRCLTNCLTRPHFVAYRIGPKCLSARLCRSLGAMEVAWTARPEDDWEALARRSDGIIFEHFLPRQSLRTQQNE